MYIFKNAAKNLLRNKGRNLLLGIIMLVMLTAIAVAVIINTTTKHIIADYKSNFGSEIYISQNLQKIQEILNSGKNDAVPGIGLEEQLSFADSDYLKETKYTASVPIHLAQLKAVGEDQQPDANTKTEVFGSESQSSESDFNFNATLIGYSPNYDLPEFKTGTRKIIEGDMPKAKTDALISENLAELNHLKVGDAITLEADFGKKATRQTLRVCGIFYDGAKDANLPMMPAQLRRNNEVLTSADTVLSYAEQIAQENKVKTDFVAFNPTYILKNPDDLAAFEKEARAKGLPDVYDVSTDQASYNGIVKPMESVSGIITVFLALVLSIGGIILVFLSTLAIRERQYEIGVLRAMGMKKRLVAKGMIYESLILVAVCLVIGLGAAGIMAGPISESMVNGYIETAQESPDNLAQNSEMFVGVGNPDSAAKPSVNPLENASVSLTWQAAAEISGFALLLAVLSCAAGLVYILRYEPIKILSERN